MTMNNSNEVPPWLREQLARFEQLQQNLQAILASKQQIDAESSEVDRAIAELKKATETDAVYKSAGNILIKSKKEDLMKDLEERKELSSTRATVLGKQEQRVRESIKELSTKLEGALKGSGTPTSAPSN
ncbi:MAG: prefoldin subunit beta [Nitrososphaerales archaeon]|jgi:prefoldin beta subunit